MFSAYAVNICTQTKRFFHFPKPEMEKAMHSHRSEALGSLAWHGHSHVKQYTFTQDFIHFPMPGLYHSFYTFRVYLDSLA